MIKSALWPLTVVAGFALGAFAGIADEGTQGLVRAKELASDQAREIVAITTISQCGKPKALIVSKGDGAQLVLSPVLANVANALYAQVPEGFAMTLELPCFTST